MTLEKERSLRDATLLDEDGRFYSLIDGTKSYGYFTQFGGLWVCYTCGHMCEC